MDVWNQYTFAMKINMFILKSRIICEGSYSSIVILRYNYDVLTQINPTVLLAAKLK